MSTIMTDITKKIAIVVVTFNRKALLGACLLSLFRQSHGAYHIIIIDNASTDGTKDYLEQNNWLQKPNIELITLEDNAGGAGGFSFGLQFACSRGFDWIWMMDDDAAPHTYALEEIVLSANDPANIYGSLAVENGLTSWPTVVIAPPLGSISQADDVPNNSCVQFLPFLGFLIHRSLVEKIGLPDAGYFIAADDVEYCIRAQKQGAKIIVSSKSRIEHPKSHPYKAKILGKTINCLALVPWKRYYDTRNRLLTAKKHHGIRLLTQTIPGSFLRFLSTLIHEPNKLAQSHAFFAGMVDGILGRKGRRHSNWKIKQ